MELKSKRVPVQIEADVYKEFQTFSDITGLPLGAAINRAAREWMKTKGAVLMEVLAERTSDKAPAAVVVPDGFKLVPVDEAAFIKAK